jgi:hypothetical protein
MAVKVKEMKDDAIVNIKVNKGYYQMVKALSFYLFTQHTGDNKEVYFKEAVQKNYADLDDLQKSFYTVALLLGEIEKEAIAEKMIEEKEILQPGDTGYVEPK